MQDCLMVRNRFRLPPFSLDRVLTFDSFLKTPINYTAMSNDKVVYLFIFNYF